MSTSNGKRGEAAAKSFKVLEREHRGRSEHGDLLGVGDRLERGAHGHFRLAVAHVAAQQAVHGLRALHIALDVGDGDGLVRRFFKLEGVFKFALERAVRRKCEALSRFSFGIQLQQFVGHVLDRLLDARLSRRPGGAAQFVEDGFRALDGAVALHQVEPLERNVEARVVRIAQAHEFAARAAVFDLMQSLELADAVVDVDDVVAGLQLGKIAEEAGRLGAALASRPAGMVSNNVPGPEDGDARIEKHDAIGEWRAAQDHRGNTAGRGVLGEARAGGILFDLAETEWNLVFVAKIDVTFEFAQTFRGEQNALARGNALARFGHERGHVAVKARGGLRLNRASFGVLAR